MGYPSTNLQGTMTSVYNIGCFVGAMSTVWTGDYFGRPRQIIVGSTIIAIGGIIQASAYGVPQMMVGRVVAGLGTGMNTSTAGVWQSETSKMNSRGKLVIIQMANCIMGFSASNWLTLGFSFAKGSVAWRFPLAFQVFFTLCIYAMCPFLPDSPRLLIRKGQYGEALEVLAALEGNGATSTSHSVKTQFNVIKDVLDRENLNSYTWFKLLMGKGESSKVPSGYYMSYVFIHALNLSPLLSRILAAAGSVDYLVFSCLAYFVIERYGRRKVMMSSSLACSICFIAITISLSLSENGHGDKYKLGIVAVSFFFAFFASFGMGVLGVPWLYPTEINALEMRTKGASLAMATNWIMITLPGIENLGWRFWIIWAVICFSFIPITYLFYPETANRTLEDIDRYFEANRGIIVAFNKTATQLSRPDEYIRMDEEISQRETVEKSSASTSMRNTQSEEKISQA
ncbi:hexose transporter protein [Trichophyton benhamiae CBS 112371]|uniref:Hexose transporter protein n=1 Tax=Arthroderma benhamiae (strain ATCC MYA-4681 / CBS 112371) TaxID=663331 RepID=D4AN70_ARTBC|nr:hexose transporter protein [Trichophyton benhamiae CBS 112371]EFE35631.1 hexose transporter protein [Trichophyton benhamiae CBS 112371]